ncbi:hypothetical protein RZ75_03560 [Apilactobacillus kunkeei]|uniref:FRG domain-containing protein n=1 Tax=Apilactobacillus kunkeei TaxID=148814 RepID=UPI0006B24585|nr:FRG domain-containing protein [Apilactobacillus kunkeei]KOY77537.1 hypothetical protein RZ75_03560 [Apilactobacillus kunkeei]
MNDTDKFLEELYKIFGYDKSKDINHQKRFTKKQVEQKINLDKYSDCTIEFKRQSVSTTLGQLESDKRIGRDGNQFYLIHEYKYDIDNKIDGFQGFKQRLDTFRENNEGKRLFFRGECGLFDYRIPSLYRHKYVEVAKNSDRFYSELLSNLGDLNLLKEPKTTQLSRLQHFNAPTRMLDITTNPLVALYFAVEKDDNEDHRLFFYAIDPSEIRYEFGHTALLKASVNWMNQEVVHEFISKYDSNTSKEEKDIIGDKFLKELNEVSNSPLLFTNLDSIHNDLTSSTFVEFVKESTRMKNQSGAFIMPPHITRMENDEEEQNKIVNDSIMLVDSEKKTDKNYEEIIIKSEAIKDIRTYLSVLGINSGYIYPDIENYSKYLVDAHYNPNDNYKE